MKSSELPVYILESQSRVRYHGERALVSNILQIIPQNAVFLNKKTQFISYDGQCRISILKYLFLNAALATMLKKGGHFDLGFLWNL